MPGAIRQAASLVLVRHGRDGQPEILVLERGAGSRFLPGYLAFPGGAVDATDSELASRWFGDEGEAARAGAIRELIEEASIAVTGDGVIQADSLAPVDKAPPAAESMRLMARWVAPEDVPVRFDAPYFTALAEGGVEPVPDMTETAAAWWSSPKTIMEEWERGERKLYWPTYFTVVQLAACDTVDDLLKLTFDPREPTEQEEIDLPRSVMYQE